MPSAPPVADTPGVTFFWPAYSLAEREVVRFLRQPGRVIGALATPILFWLFLGSGLNRSFSAPGSGDQSGYLRYAYSGTLVMVVLFTAIFSSISVIQDRNEGFLQAVLVSPAKRSSIALGKISGSAVLACMQGLMFLLLAPFAGIALSIPIALRTLLLLFIVSIGLGGVGFVLAWRTDSVQAFHSIMNLLLFPMWLLSGALFPMSGASAWLRVLMMLNPLTYGVAAVRASIDPGSAGTHMAMLWPSIVATAFGAAVLLLSTWVVSLTPKGSST